MNEINKLREEKMLKLIPTWREIFEPILKWFI